MDKKTARFRYNEKSIKKAYNPKVIIQTKPKKTKKEISTKKKNIK